MSSSDSSTSQQTAEDNEGGQALPECQTEKNRTTEPEGKHMQKLRITFNKILQRLFSAVPMQFSSFASLYKPIYAHNPDGLQQLHKIMLEQLENNLKSEIDQMYEEENIVSLMNGLDKLITESAGQKDVQAWRPSGDADKDHIAHILPMKRKQKEQMEKLLGDLESQNKLLKDAVKAREKILLETKSSIDSHIQELQEVVEVGNTLPRDKFENFVTKYGK